MREVDLAYAAGLFDGEGSINLNRGRTGACVVDVSLAQKYCDSALYWLKESFGGYVYDGPNGCKRWILRHAGAVRFLLAVFPYLHIKKVQAYVVFDFAVFSSGKRHWRTIDDKIIEEITAQRLKGLRRLDMALW